MGQRVGDSERLGVGESVGHGDVGECGSWRRESQRVSAEGESRGESEARWKRAIFSNPTHAERQRRVRGGMADVHAYALRRCATTGVGRWSAARTRFQLTPDSASGDRVEREICTARRCRCRCSAGVRQRRRSAAYVRRCVCPRRCRGLTEDVTARVVRLRLWNSSASAMRCGLGAATWIGGMLQTCDEKNVEKFAKSLRKSYLCNELKDRTLN